MVHWIYIFKCEDDVYYVGETTRLYRRFWEHRDGRGGVNTHSYSPQTLVAIYPVHKLYKFLLHIDNIQNNNFNTGYDLYFDRGGIIENFNDNEDDEFDHLQIENFITEKMMIDCKDKWKNIRGGKYTRFDAKYPFPKNKYTNELPNCNCGFPCDVKKNENENYLYFRCAKKNMWDEITDKINIDVDIEPCKFFMKFTKDNTYLTKYENRKIQIKDLIKKSGWLKNCLGGQYEYCIGGCGKSYDETNCIRYSRRVINLCFDCFLDKTIWTKLQEKYSDFPDFGKGKCLLELGNL